MTTNAYAYPGKELSLFAGAVNWKRYFSALLKPYISGDVLEAGAGIAANTRHLFNQKVHAWRLLEPDNTLAASIAGQIKDGRLPAACSLSAGTLQQLAPDLRFDCILYIDVLEHIENDRQELKDAMGKLKPGGRLIILAPAYQRLMSPFDEAVGHFRRYDKRSLQSVMPAGMKKEKLVYADCLGLLASMANRWFLKQRMPGEKQVRFWDTFLVPVSRVADRLIFHSAGKSVIGVWSKPN